MTKSSVLEIFARTGEFMTPDEVAIRLRPYRQRSCVYTYLARLHSQGLLIRARRWGKSGRIIYRLSDRGIQRLNFLKTRARQT